MPDLGSQCPEAKSGGPHHPGKYQVHVRLEAQESRGNRDALRGNVGILRQIGNHGFVYTCDGRALQLPLCEIGCKNETRRFLAQIRDATQPTNGRGR